MAMLEQNNFRTQIPTLLQSTASAFETLGNGIIALRQIPKVYELLEDIICSLKAEKGKYGNLLKELSPLANQFRKLDVEVKSHIRTVKEQAQTTTKIIEEAKKELLHENNISKHFTEIHETVKESQMSSEELKNKYYDVITKLKNCCTEAKAGYERNETKADLALKGGVFALGGTVIGAIYAAFQVATKALGVFGVPGAVAGGFLGYFGGGLVGSMAGVLPFATAEAFFRKYAEKFKILHETLSQIDQILFENYEVLTEICRLMDKLKKASLKCSSIDVTKPDMKTQDESRPNLEVLQNSHTGDKNFFIGLRFDTFKLASQALEKNCDYFLDDMRHMPLKALGFLSLKEKGAEEKKLN